MPFDYTQLDPGIRDEVRLLRACGFQTTDSGDGVTKIELIASGCAMPVPNIAAVVSTEKAMHCEDCLQDYFIDEADRMQGLLGPEWVVQASYTTSDKTFLLLATKDAEARK